MASLDTAGITLRLLAIHALAFFTACATNVEPEPDLSRSPQLSDSTAHSQSPSVELPSSHALPIAVANRSGALQIDVNLMGRVRDRKLVEDAMVEVAEMYHKCQIPISKTIREYPGTDPDNVDLGQLYALTHEYARRQPTVFIIGSTDQQDVAFSYLPSLQRDVSGTIWITDRVSNACLSWIVAHETGHILLDSGSHHPETRNIMHRNCSANNNFNRTTSLPRWSVEQCQLLRQNIASN